MSDHFDRIFLGSGLYAEAISCWGCYRQELKLLEELGELIHAASRHSNKCVGLSHAATYHRHVNDTDATTLDHVTEEIADVLIMMEQYAMMHGISREQIEKYYQKKRERLRMRVEIAKEKQQIDRKDNDHE